MTPEPIDPQPIIYALSALGFALAVAIGVWQWLRKRKAPARPEEPAPAAPLPPARVCPCGSQPTRPLPRAGMWQVPLVGRWWRRVVDGFGEAEVCDPCGRFADAALDEHLAQTVRLAHARMEREIAREMAGHERALMGAVLDALPEAQRKAWERRPKALPRRTEEGDAG